MNYLIANALAFAGWAVYGLVLVRDGGIPGYARSPAEQVLWFAVGSMFFTTSILGLPVIVLSLLAWRYVGVKTARPRLCALAATSTIAAVALLLTFPDGTSMVLLAFAAPLLLFGWFARPWPTRPATG